MIKYLWSEHSAKELRAKIKNGLTTVILPFGSTEQHGDHLVTGYDTFISERLSFDLAFKVNALVLPAFSIGEASHHIGFTGTLSFTKETIQHMLTDLCNSLVKSDIKRLIIINGHGGNYKIINSFANSYKKSELEIVHDGEKEILFKIISNLSEEYENAKLGLHAGFFETSLALYTHPEHVIVDELKIGTLPRNGKKWDKSEIENLITNGLLKTSPSGVIGDPQFSNAIDGQKFYDLIFKEYLELCTQKG